MIYRCMTLGVLALTLSACGQGIAGNGTYVSVSNVWSDGDALPKASEHCSKWGRTPRFKYFEKYTAYFDCVQPT